MKILVDISSTLLVEMWRLCAEMAPYLLFGMLVSGLITVFIDSQFIYRHIGSKDFKSVFKSTIFGVPLPLCSCGVIPVAATLRDSGASKGSTVSFLVSTPQTGIDSIFLTYGLLGPIIAIFRPLAAIFSGFLSGMIINRFDDDIYHHQTESAPPPSIKQTTLIQKINQGIVYGFKTLPADIVIPLFQGLVIAALISLLIPPELITDYFSTNTFIQFLFILGISIPFYVCATASIPIAVALMAKGISPGAAFVFLMAGPATNASSIAIIKKILGQKILYYYIALISITAVFFGVVLDFFFLINDPPNVMHHHHSMDFLTTIITSAFILIFINAYLSKFLKKDTANLITNSKENKSPSNIKIKVGGMTCSHCKESVENAVLSVKGVENTFADVKKGEVSILGSGINISSIKNKIESRGFTVLN